MWYQAAQDFLRDRKIDAWLIHDFRGSNSVLPLVLPGKRVTTRRCALWIPARGEPRVLAQFLDSPQFKGAPAKIDEYLGWREYRAWLEARIAQGPRVAMEYAPGASLPVVSQVDAGTIELVRSMGAEVVSSADVIQACAARWSPAAVETHFRVSRITAGIMDESFAMIRRALSEGRRITELDVQTHILKRFAEEKYETPDPPIVAVNGHAGDPHFEVSRTNPSPMVKGDWVLIDLWARPAGDENIFSDITWTGYCGTNVPEKFRRAFDATIGARDAALALAQERWAKKQSVQGWELDEAARAVIVNAGYERAIRHRTGHSLSPGPRVHGVGVNIDNLETHDTRELLPGIGFTIEPGVYFEDFGVRAEIDVYVDPSRGPMATGPVQREIVLM